MRTVTEKTKNIIFKVMFRRPNKVLYNIVKSRQKNEEVGEYIAYGIRAVLDGIILDEIKDVSTDGKIVKALVNKCNYHSLAIEHLRDVIEDFLLQ